jgi:hypothetical protein
MRLTVGCGNPSSTSGLSCFCGSNTLTTLEQTKEPGHPTCNLQVSFTLYLFFIYISFTCSFIVKSVVNTSIGCINFKRFIFFIYRETFKKTRVYKSLCLECFHLSLDWNSDTKAPRWGAQNVPIRKEVYTCTWK